MTDTQNNDRVEVMRRGATLMWGDDWHGALAAALLNLPADLADDLSDYLTATNLADRPIDDIIMMWEAGELPMWRHVEGVLSALLHNRSRGLSTWADEMMGAAQKIHPEYYAMVDAAEAEALPLLRRLARQGELAEAA